MYAILWWVSEDFLKVIENEDGSLRLFATLEEADAFANKHIYKDDLRVISIEGVK